MRRMKKLLALVVAVAMLASFVPAVLAETIPETIELPDASALPESDSTVAAEKTENYAQLSDVKKDIAVDANKQVDLIVVFSEDAVLDNASLESIRSGNTASTQKRMTNAHSTFLKMLPFEAEFLYDYTVLFDGVAITTAFKNAASIAVMEGVSAVYFSNTYSLPDDEVASEESPENYYSTQMTGAFNAAFRKGYSGQGIVVAVLDTGILPTHEAFQDYGQLGDVALTEEDVDAAVAGGLVQPGQYLNDKVPFAYDYYTRTTDVSDKCNSGHGTHTSGTAVGYAETEDGAVKFWGAAPGAQLLAMNIFGSQNSTSSYTYCKGLEDAIVLGADVINMSIGSDSGNYYDNGLETDLFGNIYQKLSDAGVIVSASAGNDTNMGSNSNLYFSGVIPTYYQDYGVVGSPSTYGDNMSVAAVENIAYPSYAINVDGMDYSYNDNGPEGRTAVEIFGGQTVQYVNCGFGSADDFAALTVDLTGKVALISRGTTTFSEKVANAYANGAIGAIIYNNTSGTISMSISNYVIPAVSVTQAAGQAFVAAINPETGIGTCSFGSALTFVDNAAAYTMCTFSSWGIEPSLHFKPSITAPGGNVYSSYFEGDDSYVIMSGTSMAAPNNAGAMADLLQYFTENGGGFGMGFTVAGGELAAMTKAERAKLVKAVAESTAELLEAADGVYYSPRQQGAGLVNLDNAMNAKFYIEDPTIELYDDPDKAGVFTVEFIVQNPFAERTYLAMQPVVQMDNYAGAYWDSISNIVIGGYAGEPLVLESDVDYTYTWSGANVDEGGYVDFSNGQRSAKVVLTITLTDDYKEFADYYFPVGNFIEGFVLLYDAENQVEAFTNIDGIQPCLHASFMGFYGDWTDGAILESMDFRDYASLRAQLYGSAAYHAAIQAGYTPFDILVLDSISVVGYNEAYAFTGRYITTLGQNWNFNMSYYNPYNAAISNENTDAVYYTVNSMLAYPTQLRNVRHIIMLVVDQETNEIYYVDDTAWLGKAYYSSDYASYQQQGSFVWDGWNDANWNMNHDTDEDYVPNNTKVDILYYAWINYDAEAQAAFEALEGDYNELLSSDWDENLVWNYSLTVDEEAPKAQLEIQEVPYGDLDGDGVVTAADASLLLRYLVDLSELTDDQLSLADANGDGVISVKDAAAMLRMCVGLDQAVGTTYRITKLVVSDNHSLASYFIYYLDENGNEQDIDDIDYGVLYGYDGESVSIYNAQEGTSLDLSAYAGMTIYVEIWDYATNVGMVGFIVPGEN